MWDGSQRKLQKCSFSGIGISDGKFLQSSMATSTGTAGASLEMQYASILTVKSNCLHYQLGSVVPTGVPGVNTVGQEPVL